MRDGSLNRANTKASTGHIFSAGISHQKGESLSRVADPQRSSVPRQISAMRHTTGSSKLIITRQFNISFFYLDKLNSGNGLSSSNSNLFVFKNGWTTTNKDSNMQGVGMFKARPQSSNQYAKR